MRLFDDIIEINNQPNSEEINATIENLFRKGDQNDE
jgi:hypothetical protein